MILTCNKICPNSKSDEKEDDQDEQPMPRFHFIQNKMRETEQNI